MAGPTVDETPVPRPSLATKTARKTVTYLVALEGSAPFTGRSSCWRPAELESLVTIVQLLYR